MPHRLAECFAGRRIPHPRRPIGRGRHHPLAVGAELREIDRGVMPEDVVGVEVCAAFKDLYAIGISSANGMLERVGRAPNGTLMYSSSANSGNCLEFNRIEELAECAQHHIQRLSVVFCRQTWLPTCCL